jgi:WD40 repeat protein
MTTTVLSLAVLSSATIIHRLRASSTVATVTYSPDGRRLAAVDGQTLWLWDADTGAPLWSHLLAPQDSYEVPLAFAPDGRQLAVATASAIRVVDVETGGVRTELPAHAQHEDLAWSPDSALLAVASEDGCDIWRVADGAMIARIDTREVHGVAFEGDRALVVASSYGLVNYPFDAALAVDANAEPPPLSPEEFASIHVAYGLARVADGWLADGGDDGVLEVFAPGTLAHVRTLAIPKVRPRWCLTASPAGERIAMVAEDAGRDPRRILVLDSSTGVVREDVEASGSGGADVRSLAFRPKTSQMAIATGDEVLVGSLAR